MFIEPQIGKNKEARKNRGWIEVVCGSMFSGKTEELIRRLNRAKIAQQRVEIFKPAIDTRYDDTDVVSHNENTIRSTPINNSNDMLLFVGDCEVVGVDEAQFFDKGLIDVCVTLANKGVRVIVAGLDMDFLGKPFGPIPELMSVAEYVTKVHAICVQCGSVASYSYRLSDEENRVLLGETESYEARCRSCFVEGMGKANS